MTTHVFIVDKTTLKSHLEYLFAGTGAQEKRVDFNNSPDTDLHNKTEKMLVEMIADASRIRQGDLVIFYLQQNIQQKILEGKFYGIFKIRQKNSSFIDNLKHFEKGLSNLTKEYGFSYPANSPKFKIKKKTAKLKTALTQTEERNLLRKFVDKDKDAIKAFVDEFYKDNQYLLRKLEKSLTFRTLIEPYKVYAEGVTEWEALDEIKDIRCPNQMLWSLIYRKLKGKRGNTMITIYESERLCQLIRNKNNKSVLNIDRKLLSFDVDTQKIVCLQEPTKKYQGRTEVLNVLPRLTRKSEQGNAFEAHLQAYVVKNIGTGINSSLDNVILGKSAIEWLGNEVYCGVGMQKIDVMLGLIQKEQRITIPIELKSTQANVNIIRQIQRYVDWIKQYYVPNRQSDIQPILVSKCYANRNTNSYRKLIEGIKQFNELNKPECEELKYIEFDLQGGDLVFQQVSYQ